MNTVSRVTLLALMAFPALLSCGTLSQFYEDNPQVSAILIRELDGVLTTFEQTALLHVTDPIVAAALAGVQAARRALILQLLQCLADEYPTLNTVEFYTRLNDAKAQQPLVE